MYHSKPGKCTWVTITEATTYRPTPRRQGRRPQRLPPALVTVGTLDLFRDENIDYAQSLMAAGVATELQVYARVYHGAELKARDADISKRMRLGYLEPLKGAIG